MSSLFDTRVYRRRHSNPFLKPDFELMKGVLEFNGPLKLKHEKDHKNSRWILEFFVDKNEKRSVFSIDYELCLWRAIEVYENYLAFKLSVKYGTTKDLRGIFHYARQSNCPHCGAPMFSNEKKQYWCSNIYCSY